MEHLLKNRPIGVFDSGVGGLTVVRSLRKAFPDEDIIYFGDTARVPYGTKSKETVRRFSREIMDFLLRQEVKLIVAACNTVSSLAIPVLKKEYPVPVIGVIRAGVLEAASATKSGRVAVIGTNSTIASNAYEDEMKKIYPSCRVYSSSCPLFVPLVENGWLDDDITVKVAARYLEAFKGKKIDTMILGCTHYPLLKDTIRSVMGGGVNLIDSASAVAKEVGAILKKNDIFSAKSGEKRTVKYFVSDDVAGFKKVAGIFLSEEIPVKKVSL